jgi:hypothetical protein
MRLALSFLFSLCALVSLYAQTDAKLLAVKQANPPDTNPQYFPIGLFSNYPQLSESRARWYADELRDLEDPSLRRGKIMPGTQTPFTPSLVVRLTVNPDGTGKLLAKLGTKLGGVGGTVTRQQTLFVSMGQMSKFLSLLREANFWSLPTARYEETLVRVADEKVWLLEANKGGRYHVVSRSDGLIEVNFSRACDYLLELSPVKAETGYRTRSTIQQSVPTD